MPANFAAPKAQCSSCVHRLLCSMQLVHLHIALDPCFCRYSADQHIYERIAVSDNTRHAYVKQQCHASCNKSLQAVPVHLQHSSLPAASILSCTNVTGLTLPLQCSTRDEVTFVCNQLPKGFVDSVVTEIFLLQADSRTTLHDWRDVPNDSSTSNNLRF